MPNIVFAMWPLALSVLMWCLVWLYPVSDSGNERSIGNLGIAAFVYLVILFRATFSKTDRMISINFCIYNIFMFLFPAMYHCYRGYFPFFDLQYDQQTIEYASSLVYLFATAFFVGQTLVNARYPVSLASVSDYKMQSSRNMMLFSLISIPVAGVFAAMQGFDALFARRAEYFGTDAATPFDIIVVALARYPIFVGFIVATLLFKQRASLERGIVLAVTGVMFWLTNYPLAIPRTYLFGYIIVFLLLFVDYRKRSSKLAYVGLSVFAITVLFGIADNLARGELGVYDFDFLTRYLETGDFDGFQSTINVVVMVRDLGMNYGRNLLSALLFFVPRVVWSGKSPGTGVDAAEHLELDFTNLSAPIMAESYVDFGLLGVIAGGVLVGWVLARCDQRSHLLRAQALPVARLTLAILGGFVIILARGSLVAVASHVVVLMVVSTVAIRFSRLSIKMRSRENVEGVFKLDSFENAIPRKPAGEGRARAAVR